MSSRASIRASGLAPVLAALLALALSGCAALESLAKSAFDPPKLEFVSWSADSLDAEGVTIALHYKLTNPNPQGFRLSRVGWALDLEGKPAAKGDMPSGLTIPSRGAAPLDVPVRLRWRDVPGLVQLVATRSDVAFKVTGRAAVASGLGDVEVPFSREGRLPLPRIPRVGIESVKVRPLSLGTVSVDLKLRVDNGNSFPLPVGALAYGLKLDGSPVATGDGHPLAAVPAHGAATVSIPVRISLAAAGPALQRLLSGDSVPVDLDGKAGYGGLEFPFEARKR